MAEKFVRLFKDGETIKVNSICVDDHKRLGWKEVAVAVETSAETPSPDTSSRKKAKAEAKKAAKKPEEEDTKES